MSMIYNFQPKPTCDSEETACSEQKCDIGRIRWKVGLRSPVSDLWSGVQDHWGLSGPIPAHSNPGLPGLHKKSTIGNHRGQWMAYLDV